MEEEIVEDEYLEINEQEEYENEQEEYENDSEEDETDVEENEADVEEYETDDIREEETWTESSIPVIVTTRSHLPLPSREREQCALRQVRANDRVAASAELPTVGVTNFRSLGPRIHNVKDDMLLRDIEVQLASETWEKESNQKLKCDIEEMFELHGLQYISCPRPNKKRGGGAAIIVNTRRFSISKLDITVPSKLEVVWGILRPKKVSKMTIFKEFIICALYSPPNYKKNNELQTHIISTMHHLLTMHPKAAYCIGGDKNSLKIAPIMAALPHCVQAVTLNTYKEKILDVILWNLSQYYSVPYIAPAVQPDNSRTHVPSDHNNAVAVPLAGAGAEAKTREYTVKTNRPLPASGIREMGLWLSDIKWEAVLRPELCPEDQDAILRSALQYKVDQIFPEKKVRVSNQDVSFITLELKRLQMYIKREYKKKGKSCKYIEMKIAYDRKFKKAAQDQLNKFVEDMMEESPGRAYSAMKKMGTRPGDCENDGVFNVVSHQTENLNLEQSTHRILQYFSNISQQYEALDISKLPVEVQNKLSEEINPRDIPRIEPFQVFEKMRKCKKTKSAVPGEMPSRLRQEFNVELAEPASIIFNNIAQSATWPQSWKEEFGTILKKCNVPEDESMLRVISITYQLSTLMERFVIDWLMVYIEDKLDRDQFGGQKGHSIAHYLIEITNFILYNQDLSKPLSTLFAGIDISKGFNKIDHCKLVKILSTEMQVPCWLLKIVVSYLSGRTLTLRRQGHTSSTEQMPGGTAAGTPLGLLCFLILFNRAGPPASLTSIGEQVTVPRRRRKPMEKGKVKWIDDKSLMVSLDLATSLVPDTRPDIPRPVPYRGRLGLMLPRETNEMQNELDSLNLYAQDHLMSVNKEKTKIMLFSRQKKYDFLPELQLIQGQNIEVVEEMKIVGVILRSDLKTSSNTRYIIKKAYSRMWIIRRLKALGASRTRLLDVLQKQVLSTLLLAVPAWDCFLSLQEKTDLDRVLKTGLRVIWGQEYISFDKCIQDAKLKTLQQIRDKIVQKFVKTSVKHGKFSKWFSKQPAPQINTRTGKKTKYKVVTARTSAYRKSAIPTLTTIANKLPNQTWDPI